VIGTVNTAFQTQGDAIAVGYLPQTYTFLAGIGYKFQGTGSLTAQ
jgi:hypothetical protein